MSKGVEHIRLLGGFVLWVFNRKKVPFNECTRKSNAIEVGV